MVAGRSPRSAGGSLGRDGRMGDGNPVPDGRGARGAKAEQRADRRNGALARLPPVERPGGRRPDLLPGGEGRLPSLRSGGQGDCRCRVSGGSPTHAAQPGCSRAGSRSRHPGRLSRNRPLGGRWSFAWRSHGRSLCRAEPRAGPGRRPLGGLPTEFVQLARLFHPCRLHLWVLGWARHARQDPRFSRSASGRDSMGGNRRWESRSVRLVWSSKRRQHRHHQPIRPTGSGCCCDPGASPITGRCTVTTDRGRSK